VTTDDAAFTTLVHRHSGELHRHCTRMLRSPVDAEDALQDTLLRAWRSRRTLASSSPRGWLYRIATNACIDLIARRPTLVDGTPAREPVAPPEQQPDAVLVARETLVLALQHLPPRQHVCFVLRDVLDWSAGDTASALSISVPAANSALQRARRRLRTQLAQA
jgi:RNA polymerase sigma factor (sigma-70 family)